MSERKPSGVPSDEPKAPPKGAIPEVVPERHLRPEFPDGAPESMPVHAPETAESAPPSAPRSTPTSAPVRSKPVREAPEFILTARAEPVRPSRRDERRERPARKRPERNRNGSGEAARYPRFTLVTVVSLFRSVAVTFAAAVIVATIFMWWTSPDFLPAQARSGLAPVQATARQVVALPTPLPTPVWFNRIGVLAGHSGIAQYGSTAGNVDPGTTCPDGFNELTITTAVANQVVAMLRGRGFTVDLLEEFDPALEGYQAAAFISLHADSCEDFGYGGFKSTYPHLRTVIRDQDIRLDQCVQAKYRELTGLDFLPDNITPNMTQYHAFQRISRTTPANILELGFLSYDRDLLQNRTDLMAQAIVNGLLCFLNPVELATMQAPPPAESPVPAPTALPVVPGGPDVVPTPTLGLP
ncbi:MAG: N-acetylmuramoyl-L-alanine amidase [Anaerolineae bacterium]|nr:N-acetylmuramoyl-L-alanine amidase [Anaerolineae bacterium]